MYLKKEKKIKFMSNMNKHKLFILEMIQLEFIRIQFFS